MADLVIRGALLCDGSGREAARGDLAVTGDRIAAVGRAAEHGAREVDGAGLALAPGFIDVHTHYDCQLFWDPQASPSPWHGVTTVVMGNCGFTIAPCREADRETLMQLLLFVEGMPIETLRAGIAWTWEDFAGYLGARERQGRVVGAAPRQPLRARERAADHRGGGGASGTRRAGRAPGGLPPARGALRLHRARLLPRAEPILAAHHGEVARRAAAALRRRRVPRRAGPPDRLRGRARAGLGPPRASPGGERGRPALAGQERRRDRGGRGPRATRRLLRPGARGRPRHPVGRRPDELRRARRGRADPASCRTPRALRRRRARRHALRPGLHQLPPRPLGAGAPRARARGGGAPGDRGAGGALRAPRPGPPRPRLRRRPGALRSRARRHAPDRDGVRPAARAAPPPPARRGHRRRARQRHAGGRGRCAHRPPPRPCAARGSLMRTDAEAREQIIQITNELFAMGLLTPTGGNVSARAADPELYWITPSRMYKGGLTREDLVCIKPDGTVCEGTKQPSVEYQMHWASYQARPDASAAVHTHAPIATAFGITNQSFPPINTDAIFLADTKIVPWYMPGSKELADAVGEALKASRGAILQCHGLMTVGKTMRDAATRAMMLEETAKILLYCKQFGGELTLIPSEWVERLAAVAEFV